MFALQRGGGKGASTGSTLGLLEASATRKVEVKPMKVHLQAQHMAAPFAGFVLLAQGKFYYTHRGVVGFDPKQPSPSEAGDNRFRCS